MIVCDGGGSIEFCGCVKCDCGGGGCVCGECDCEFDCEVGEGLFVWFVDD